MVQKIKKNFSLNFGVYEMSKKLSLTSLELWFQSFSYENVFQIGSKIFSKNSVSSLVN